MDIDLMNLNWWTEWRFKPTTRPPAILQCQKTLNSWTILQAPLAHCPLLQETFIVQDIRIQKGTLCRGIAVVHFCMRELD